MKVNKLLLTMLLVCCVAPMFAQNVQSVLPIIPQPVSVSTTNDFYVLKNSDAITYSDRSLQPAAEYLSKMLSRATGFSMPIKRSAGAIQLELTTVGKEGSYALRVDKKGVLILGNGYKGIINGIQTLRQLLPDDIESKTTVSADKRNSWTIPFATIVDEPRFDWRGMHIDCSRHFYTVDEMKEILDVISLYKINKLHWHLTDDQGWRIEIKKYPLLTQKGAYRILNNQDTVCLKRAKAEDNPTLLLPQKFCKTDEQGRTIYGGFYTQDQIRDIVAYATVRGIDVVPEIDMPGHFLSAIENYDGLSCFKEIGWGTLFTTPLCPGKDKMIEFCKDIWSEIIPLFPYEYVHFGGDEVDMKNWKKCPDCQKRIRDNSLKDEHELQSWFMHKMEEFINSKGKKVIGWDEIIAGGLSNTSTIMWWRSWNKTALDDATTHGNPVICTPNAEFYFDYQEDSKSIPNIYNFDPQPDRLSPAQKNLVLGVQGNNWAEYIPSIERLYYQAFPRMIAVAELGWTAVDRKDLQDFKNRLQKHYPRLQKMGVNYRIPDLQGFYNTNVFTDSKRVEVTSHDPSATIYYTTDGSMPTNLSQRYTQPILVDHDTEFQFRPYNQQGLGGEVVKTSFRKEALAPAKQVVALNKGLRADWYDYTGPDCAGIDKAKHNGTFVADGVVIPNEVSGNIGLILTGTINVPADDIYTFCLLSDDGSYLKIDGKMIVDNDGEHSPKELIGQHAMKSGQHDIYVRYFDHNGGTLQLRVLDSKGQPVKVWYHH